MSSVGFTDEPVVVGTDGSASATRAVRWAADVAARHHVELRILHAFRYSEGIYAGQFPPPPGLYEAVQSEGKRILSAAVGEAQEVAPAVVVRSGAVNTPPVPFLVEESHNTRMVVLGASGRGGFTGMLTGSTAAAVVTHAKCPVVVVRGHEGETEAPGSGPVVVGVDGSPVSERGTAAAFEEASLRCAPLVAVHAPAKAEDGAHSGTTGAETSHDQGSQRLLAERLAGWQEKYPDVRVERVVVRGAPRDELLERSRTARLVVVGSRGRGGFRGMLLGSTSQALVHHAQCPVMVVRPG